MPRAPLAALALALFIVAAPAAAGGFALAFGGTGSGDVDRVKIRVDDPGHALPGPPIDIGAADFTIEFWIKAQALHNPAAAVACGANAAWINGHVVVDRDRFNQDRKFGVAIAGGRVVFGVSGNGTGDRTLCGSANVLDDQWHHVAVQRRATDGFLWVWVDGALDASGDGPDGTVSYPDNGVPGNFCGPGGNQPCTNSDPFLVLGAEKHDAGAAFPSYRGLFDELRVSGALRYLAPFARPRAPFGADTNTLALFHFDEGSGTTAYDTSGRAGAVQGDIRRATPASSPTWTTDVPFVVGPVTASIRLAQVASGLVNPVDLVAAPGDASRLFVVEQPGRIRILRDGLVMPVPFLDVTGKTAGGGESGLLGLAFHPNYAANRRFFVYYTRAGDGALIVERYERAIDHPEHADAASARILLTIPHPGATNHNGGKLAFGHDGLLYIGTGDGGGGNEPFNNGQNFAARLGKFLRVDADVETPPYYTIPAGNPFPAGTCSANNPAGACPEVWSLGWRNPWRWSFDRLTGDLFVGDVGQGAREEIDWEPRGTPGGRNYGWRILEGSICTPAFGATCTPPPNYAPPILDYGRSAGQSLTGGFRYRGARIAPLASAYVYGDFGSGRIWAATHDGATTWTGQQLLLQASGVSAFGEDSAGELYVANYFNGTISRIDPADTDGDGLPDWWELAWFGSATAAVANADGDGDGATNLAEWLALSNPLVVDACAGFADVASNDGHCNAVEWMRNRAITTGCGGTLYCPTLDVIRASMALFQQRLGGALTPLLGYTESATGALALAAQEILCASAHLPAANNPRDVEVRYALSTEATAPLTLGVTVVVSRNGGATWEPVTQTRMRAQTPGQAWRSTSSIALASVAAGEAARFALALDREAGTGTLNATRCRVVTMAINRDGAAPPRDAALRLPP